MFLEKWSVFIIENTDKKKTDEPHLGQPRHSEVANVSMRAYLCSVSFVFLGDHTILKHGSALFQLILLECFLTF